MAGGNEERGINSRFGKPPIIASRPVLKVGQLREADLRFGNDMFLEPFDLRPKRRTGNFVVIEDKREHEKT